MPVNESGEHWIPRSGDIVELDHFEKREFILEGGIKMLLHPKIFTILDHVKKESTQKYTLDEMYFYDWGVVLRNKNSKCVLDKENWDKLTGLETSSALWKLKQRLKIEEQKEAYVEITTLFDVYYRWSLDNYWLYHKADGFEWRLTSENLYPMKKIVIEDIEARKARLLLNEIKTRLQYKLFLAWDDILELARKYTVPERDVEEYVKNVVWKKDYDEEFTEFLKSRAKAVLYGLDGLFFVMPGGITILEEPEYGKASYVFVGEPNFIASKIEGIKREVGKGIWREALYRLQKIDPSKMPWFVGRVIHYDKEQWIRDVTTLLEGGEGRYE
ncbi:MAG: hypothetical protein QW764_02925 [Desulfurococcaceae archaeon]